MNKHLLFLSILSFGLAVKVGAVDPVQIPITAICVDQDKPPCLFETQYLSAADGSNPVKIELAFPITARSTNSEGIPYTPLTNVTFSPDQVPATATNLWLPQGSAVVLPHNVRLLGSGQLVSVTKIAPASGASRAVLSPSPVIVITSPSATDALCPLIELEGNSNIPLKSVRFDVVNRFQRILDREAIITDTHFDTALWAETTNYFQCPDINLAVGTNQITLRCEDDAGHVSLTNLVYILRREPNKPPPSVSINWPPSGKQLSGAAFSVRGQIDVIAATVTGRISAHGQTIALEGLVERTGRFWVENVPLLDKTNLLTLVVTDAWGNSTVTNLPVIRSDNLLTVDPVPTTQLWQLQVKVTGKVYPVDQEVWLNGLKATVNSNGTWVATGIPLNKEGVAIFEALSVPRFASSTLSLTNMPNTAATVAPQNSVSMQTALTSNEITLNASLPTYGTFKLHLTGIAERGFIISASPNLVDWTPILTNRDAGSTFDYTDTNVVDYGCRFFRVSPIK